MLITWPWIILHTLVPIFLFHVAYHFEKLGKGFRGGYILPVCIIISINSYTSSLVYCFVVLIVIVNVISLSINKLI